jgi:CRP-like cAMP-binding protein
MTTASYQQLFRFVQAMADVPDRELAQLVAIFRPAHLIQGQFFIQAGDIPQTLGFLVSGICRLYYIDDTGTEWTKSFCVANDVVAAYSALLLGETSPFFIQALTDCSLLVAQYTAYQAITSEHGCWQILKRKLAETLFIKKEKRESQLLLDDARTRYRKFLAEYPGLEAQVKQYHIASYLGITPVSLSRIRTQLKDD